MQDDRKLAVLRAIVEDYVATQEPVGSKALVERHQLGVSPATVRNDMAALEEEGFITQPHTSAGRIPTDKGYRLFVDRLTTLKPMSAAEKRAIATFLDGAVDLDDVVHRSVRLLSQLTHQVAIVQYPTLSRSTVRHVELVALAPDRLLVVLILSHRPGRAAGRRAADEPSTDDDARRPPRAVNRAVIGETIADAADRLSARPDEVRRRGDRSRSGRRRARRGDVRPPLRRAGRGRRHRQPGPVRRRLRRRLRPLLEALEEHVVLLKLLGEAGTRRLVTVRIGHEGPYEELARPAWSPPATAPGTRRWPPGHRRPDPDGLPRHDGRRARRRPLRLPILDEA